MAAVQHKSPGRMTKEAAQERGIERTFAMFARACVVAMVAAAANHPEASAGLLRTALIEAKMGLLACVALLFALGPLAFSRAGSPRASLSPRGPSSGTDTASAACVTFPSSRDPCADVVPAACENGVTRWMMLVIDGPGAKGGKK